MSLRVVVILGKRSAHWEPSIETFHHHWHLQSWWLGALSTSPCPNPIKICLKISSKSILSLPSTLELPAWFTHHIPRTIQEPWLVSLPWRNISFTCHTWESRSPGENWGSLSRRKRNGCWMKTTGVSSPQIMLHIMPSGLSAVFLFWSH